MPTTTDPTPTATERVRKAITAALCAEDRRYDPQTTDLAARLAYARLERDVAQRLHDLVA